MTAVPVSRTTSATIHGRRFLEAGGVVWLLVIALFISAATMSDDFATARNLSNLSRQLTVLALVALGQFLVVLTAGIDLSVGSIVKLTSLLAAITMAGSNGRLLPGLAVALGVGALAGAVNGTAIVRLRVPPFVTTLGTLAVLQGLALFIAPTPRGRTSPLLVKMFSWQVGPVYAVVLLVALVWLVVWWWLSRARWGRHVYAVGGQEEVARLTGVAVGRIRFSVYVLSGLLAGLAGAVTVAKSGVGDPNAGLGLEFESLAAVVVGGVSLFGGRGRLLGVLGGVVLLGMVSNIFNLVGIDVWYQQLLKGLLILLAGALYVQKR
jgi:ribose/xylose/arabinose/galactoside ABC-type transport system permease subunit